MKRNSCLGRHIFIYKIPHLDWWCRLFVLSICTAQRLNEWVNLMCISEINLQQFCKMDKNCVVAKLLIPHKSGFVYGLCTVLCAMRSGTEIHRFDIEFIIFEKNKKKYIEIYYIFFTFPSVIKKQHNNLPNDFFLQFFSLFKTSA